MTEQATFDQAFRGYDREQVDSTVAQLRAELDELRRSGEAQTLETEARVQHLSEDLDAVFGINATYRSETNAGFGGDPRLDIDGYALIDARAGVRSSDGWEASVFVRNLTDEYYWTNVARLSDVIRRYAGEPRTYGVRLSARF